ncbi:hypothetical protein HBH96_152440 [Parastagonospora nodorum]|nr:hypothetical protein HBH96_152440 [Parastagonospora nodorum]KAH5248426.1 hypothetical protein HBI71_172870 [Parastagonospora nodorum]
MAPNGHAPAGDMSADNPSQVSSRPKWHARHGSGEFKIWQKEHPSEHISYDEWKSPQPGKGLSLYYAALHIWEESDSTDEEIEQPKIDARSRTARGQPAREPKKTLKANGNGLSRSVGSATPSGTAQSEDLSPSSKKRRKSRKKYLSQEIVASDENEDVEADTPTAEATTPSAPVITVNGRRKSSNRKPKKKPLSEEIVSPEDEEDPMALNGISAPAIASPLPVRSAPKSATTGTFPQPYKKTILKLSTRKTPKKKVLSEETVQDEDADIVDGTASAISNNITLGASAPSITATIESHGTPNANTTRYSNGATASPDPMSESASAARRGLRARRPAQQRPYSFDAEIFEGSDVDAMEEESMVQETPGIQSRRVSIASVSKEPLGQLDDETLAILQGGVDREPEAERDSYGRSKHFKGKGRAWKKEGSDEDHEFNPGKKKSAKAKAKAKAAAAVASQPPRKRGRPKKSIISEDIVRDDSDEEALTKPEDGSPAPGAPDSTAKKTRKPSRKSILSEELVKDTDEDEDTMAAAHASVATSVPEVSTPVPKKRGRPRKSDQSLSSKTSVAGNEEPQESASFTPKGTPTKSNTPKGEPEDPVVSVEEAMPVAKTVEQDPPAPVEPVDIEAHMASVNAEDDDEELS